VDLHFDPLVLAYIVSVIRPEKPELKIYQLLESHHEAAPYRLT
jgi:hypothetical protein